MNASGWSDVSERLISAEQKHEPKRRINGSFLPLETFIFIYLFFCMFVLFGSMKSLGIDCVGRKLVYDYDVFPKKKKSIFFLLEATILPLSK